MHAKGVCMAWWLVMGYDNEIVHMHKLFCFGTVIIIFVICSLYLFPCILISYVIRLHRLRIGGGEIQGTNGQEGQNKETNEEM